MPGLVSSRKPLKISTTSQAIPYPFGMRGVYQCDAGKFTQGSVWFGLSLFLDMSGPKNYGGTCQFGVEVGEGGFHNSYYPRLNNS